MNNTQNGLKNYIDYLISNKAMTSSTSLDALFSNKNLITGALMNIAENTVLEREIIKDPYIQNGKHWTQSNRKRTKQLNDRLTVIMDIIHELKGSSKK